MNFHFFYILALFSFATGVTLISLSRPVEAATYTVINTADSGTGSLRQAVADANSTTAADTITFNIAPTDPNCMTGGICTIKLISSALTVQSSGGALTVMNQGGAEKLIISGNNMNRVFINSGGDLTLDGLTITQGVNAGGFGVVYSTLGSLTVKNSVLTRNSGGYVLYSHSFESNGVLNVINSSIHDNSGIGIYITNNLTTGGLSYVSNSTISNNQGEGAGGGNGGGIYFLGNQMNITNSTVSGNTNSGGGGIFAARGSVLLTNCTITNNSAQSGGGIQIYQSEVKLRNTIVAGNTSSGGTPDFVFPSSGLAVSLGNNLIGNSVNVGNPRGFWIASDILNQTPRLAPLAHNGGATQTHALLYNSPAINKGSNCVLTANGCGDNNPPVPTDQRGRNRIGIVDIGAFEYSVPPTFDFDGDGKADLSVFRPSAASWFISQSSNNAFVPKQFGANGDLIAPADYDGDRKTDLCVFRPTDGGWYRINSSDNTFVPVQFGSYGDVPVPGDFDGDGKADPAVFRPSIGYWLIARPTGVPAQNFDARQFGMSTDKPLAGTDFDGDGKTDLAVYRPSNGYWYRINSSNDTFSPVKFGIAEDLPVPADYDGDGKTDLAVYRPSAGDWYLIFSATDSFTGFHFGISEDKPAPADFDGDGKADYVVFRPSTGTWYLLRSTAGFTGFQFGASGDIPTPSAFIR